MSHTEKRIEMVKLLQKLRVGDEKPGETVLQALRLMAAVRYRDTDYLVTDGLNGLKDQYPKDLAFADAGFALGVVRAVLDGALNSPYRGEVK